MASIILDGVWTLTYGPEQRGGPACPGDLARTGWPTVPARVPGNVELDLAAAGVLPENLDVGNRIYEVLPYETYEWWYRRQFACPPAGAGQRIELVFDGLDCLGTVWLNGREVGRTDNMLIAHRFDVTGLLPSDGPNELVVRIGSAVLAGRRHAPAAYESAMEGNWESLAVRKAPHMYGWDIMPRVVTAGLWRGVSLEVLNPTRWRSVYWATLRADADRRTATVLADWDFVTDRPSLDGLTVRLTLQRDGRVAHHSQRAALGTHGRVTLSLQDVDLWWPRGFGEPSLYDATAELLDAQGAVLDVHRCRVGLRTAELVRTDVTTEAEGGEFVFVVNGQKVFAKGTNWVPLDAFHSRDGQHLQAAVDMLADLNCNMVRCWGGNVYEDHAFFDLCDARGIMVWQDFAMACAIYPQDDGFAEAIRREAEHVVTKLRGHASLVLWAGNNEIDEMFGWTPLGLDPNTERLSRQVLPEVLRRLDPFRPYLPSSPYRSPELVGRGNDGRLKPEDHLWGPRDDFKGPFYTGSAAHFVSEIGYHGCPDCRSLRQMLDAEHLWPPEGNEQWLTKAVRPVPLSTQYNYRIPLMSKQIAVLFDRVPKCLEDFALASQISQAEAKKFFIERMRSGKWRRTGILWWNLRDGWGIISDAVVDYYGRKKLAYAYIRRVQADVVAICCEAQGGAHPLVVVNDTRRDVAGRVEVRDADTSVELLAGDFRAPANGKADVGSIPRAAAPGMWLIRWTLDDGAEGHNHYLAGPRPFRLEDFRRWIGRLGLTDGVEVLD